MPKLFNFVCAGLAATCLLVSAIGAQAAELKVIASPAMSSSLAILGPSFEETNGKKLSIKYGLGAEQRAAIEAGTFDLAIVPGDAMDEMAAINKVDSGTRTDIARLGLGIAAKAGSNRMSVATPEEFREALLRAHSVTFIVPEEATGRHIISVFQKLDIADQMRSKTIHQKTVSLIGPAVARGDAELGFSFTSNLLPIQGITVVGEFPAELQYYSDLAAAVLPAATEREAALALIAFLRSPESLAVMTSKGLGAPKASN